MAPTTRNRGRPKTVRQLTPESQQPYLPTSTPAIQSKRPPATKPSSKPRSKIQPKSESKKPQQTITQMPLLHQLYHPELYQTELKYEEVQQAVNVEDEPLALRSPKRRKITETPSREGDTREDKSVNASHDSSPITAARNIHQRSGGSSAVKRIQAMPPPATTPKRPIRKEIPSSQSPFDTPLFALSRRSSKRDTSRSPLTERSMNLQTPIPIAPKISGGLSTREVADSMETDDEGEGEDENPLLDSQTEQRILPEKERFNRRRTDPEESDTSHVQVKTSFQRETWNDDGVMNQVGRSSTTSPSKATSRSLEESAAVPTQLVNASTEQKHTYPSHPTSSNVRMTDQIDPVDEPPLETIPSSPPMQKPDIDSLAARCLPTLAVETDSQFEAGWHTYHPPRPTTNPPPPAPSSSTKENNNQPSSSQLQYIPSSQPNLDSPPPPIPSHTSTDQDTAPTQPLPTHQTPPPTSHVPASQATTTASPTQPQCISPHNDEEKPHILVPSSPSPPGFASSVVGRWGSHERTDNNNDDGGGDMRAAEQEWGPDRRMRASQLLLPASFLKDSWFVGPDDIGDGGVVMGEGEWIEEDD